MKNQTIKNYIFIYNFFNTIKNVSYFTMDSLETQQLEWCLIATADFSLKQPSACSQRILSSLLVLWVPLFKVLSVFWGFFFRFIVLKGRAFIHSEYFHRFEIYAWNGAMLSWKLLWEWQNFFFLGPYPVDKTAKTSLPLRRALTAVSRSGFKTIRYLALLQGRV